MRNVYNFSAGPSMLPEEVLKQAQAEMLDWHGTGVSAMEMGHRSADFKTIVDQSEADLRELMNVPENYHVLFLDGGASPHFSMVPMNLFHKSREADYVDTGIWSKKAMAEAERYGKVNIVTRLHVEHGLVRIPKEDQWNRNPNAAYLHYTPNETIEGIEFHWVPETGDVPLVADMTSMILSRPIDVSRFGIIYAGVQKNLGQAGLSVAIVRNDLAHEPLPFTPVLYRYKTQIENQSLYHTPPMYAWYITGLMLTWMKQKGGVEYFEKINQRKAEKLYAVIDQHKSFYLNGVHPENRSIMNVLFKLPTSELTDLFISEAAKVNLVNLKGHKLSGGIRASIYNGMPEKGVDLLAEFMQEFVRVKG